MTTTTPDMINSEPAGRRLPNWLATLVMGWHRNGEYWYDASDNLVVLVLDWDPDTNIADAMEALIEYAGAAYFEIHNGDREIDGERRSGITVHVVVPGAEGEGFAPDLALAVCRGLLLAAVQKQEAE